MKDGTKIQGSARTKRNLRQLCHALRQADPDILEIIQFGSSVYAPDLAHDFDLLVTTSPRKAEDVYWETLADWGGKADLLIREPGQRMGSSIALSVFTASKVLYGNGQTIEEARGFMTVPTYEEARKLLVSAAEDLALAHRKQDEFFRDRRYRAAFDTLFDAARYAVMTFLSTEETRWGQLRRSLPRPFATRFRRLIGKLHIQYSYDGNYPKDSPDAEFAHWRQIVSQFIRDWEQYQP